MFLYIRFLSLASFPILQPIKRDFRLPTTAMSGTFSAPKQPPIAKPALFREYPKTIVLVFPELVLFWGSEPLHGKIVSDGDVVQVKE